MTRRAAPGWDALRGSIAGAVVLPGSSAYESARRPAIANVQARVFVNVPTS